MNLRSFLIWLVILSLNLGCQSFEIRNYQVAYKYHSKVGGGVTFGVLKHEFVELTDNDIQQMLKTAVILPADSWAMIAVDLIKACKLLGKKCNNEVAVLNSVFKNLFDLNNSPVLNDN